jgi:hypothetical protein
MSVNSLRFEARWSRLVWSVTVAVLALVAVAEVLLVQAAFGFSPGQPGQAAAVVGALLSVSIFAGIARFAPCDYRVRSDAIVVGRLGTPLMIPYQGIREVRRTHRQEIGFAWRVFGSAGFLGWFGLFRSRTLGEFRACATNLRDLVLITRTNGAKIVISPHLPDAFLEAVRRNMDRAA